MDCTDEITSNEDIIDSRDVIARIDYLKPYRVVGIVNNDVVDEFDSEEDARRALANDFDVPEAYVLEIDEDEADELRKLRELADEGENLADWTYGETLVRDSYFEDYARELADDIGAINRDAGWPLCHIDWEAAADALRVDYTEVTFDGVTYLARG